jgi:hypothetical protein
MNLCSQLLSPTPPGWADVRHFAVTQFSSTTADAPHPRRWVRSRYIAFSKTDPALDKHAILLAAKIDSTIQIKRYQHDELSDSQWYAY